ncbi:hypothetical protein Tco_0155305 [Tanacetum coccineum]
MRFHRIAMVEVGLSELEKKVEALSKIDHSKVIEESVQANVTNEVRNQVPKLLPQVVSDFIKPRMESIVCDVLQNTLIYLAQPSSTLAESLTKYDLKKILLDKMHKSQSFQTHEKHLDLYNALINSAMLDKAISSSDVNPSKVLKRSRPDDQDPPTGFDKEKKKRMKRKDLIHPKDKEPSGSAPKGKTQSKPSSTDKSVNVEETVHDVSLEEDQPMGVEEDVGNVANEQPQDDVVPKKDNFVRFKQDARPETLDPKWHKEPNTDDLTILKNHRPGG